MKYLVVSTAKETGKEVKSLLYVHIRRLFVLREITHKFSYVNLPSVKSHETYKKVNLKVKIKLNKTKNK